MSPCQRPVVTISPSCTISDILSHCWRTWRPLTINSHYKSSAVAEMGDRLATIDMGRKVGSGYCGGTGSPLGHHLTQCGLGRGLPLYQVTSWSIQPFRHICRNATLLRVGIPLRAIFIPSLVVTHQNIYSTRALSYCSIPNQKAPQGGWRSSPPACTASIIVGSSKGPWSCPWPWIGSRSYQHAQYL